MSGFNDVKALLFDVFGTVVDWRSSVIHELETFGTEKGIERDWTGFTDKWRASYQPAMEEVRSGRSAWTILDELHRETLIRLLDEFSISGLSKAEIDHLNRAWHRLLPWPDSVEGLQRLKSKFIIGTQSNGNIALMVNLAKHSNLAWDVILGAETARAYKPLPESYLRNVALLGLEPGECMLVAAHNDDLAAATALGLRSAFVLRPTEYGPDQSKDLQAEEGWDIVAKNLIEVADELGC
ncbi:(S)-2-haloacid dehalogenase 4A [bacterium MnTg02]|nr:(S)-2-haloacid dehalogenase 4A [bacterium MnTg02]